MEDGKGLAWVVIELKVAILIYIAKDCIFEFELGLRAKGLSLCSNRANIHTSMEWALLFDIRMNILSEDFQQSQYHWCLEVAIARLGTYLLMTMLYRFIKWIFALCTEKPIQLEYKSSYPYQLIQQPILLQLARTSLSHRFQYWPCSFSELW